MKIKKDMMVKVVAGNFKGLSGKVLKVIPETQRAIVEGVATCKSCQSFILFSCRFNE